MNTTRQAFAAQIAYYENLAVKAEEMGLPAIIAEQHRAVARDLFTASLTAQDVSA